MKTSLSPPVKLAGFAGSLVLVLAAGFGAARAVAPEALADRGSTGGHGGHGSSKDEAEATLPGLAVAQSGYRFVPDATTLTSGPAQTFRFRLVGPEGSPVQRYDLLHERELHLIVVRRDLTGFQHVHPERGADGTWETPLDLRPAGTWRAFADFRPAGGPGQLTLGVDLHVSGTFEAGTSPTAAGPSDSRMTAHFDRQGEHIEIEVLRDGVPVETEPYLGARGHLVALRAGDLAYLHVHPVDGGAPAVGFNAELPSPGTYGLFFDYQLDGTVHTATTSIEVSGDGHGH